MADTVAITAGTGTTIGTDEVTIGGTLQHVQRVKLVDGADGGTGLIGGDATNGLDVDVTRVIPGTGATALGKAEDTAHTDGDTGVLILGVRNHTTGSTTDGDYSAISVSSTGDLHTFDHRDTLRIAVTSGGLTTATTAYTAGDQVGTQFTFANAARVSGGTGRVVGCVLMDETDIIGPYDLVLSRASMTLAADNAAYAVSDGDAANVIGIIQMAGSFDIGNNRIAQAFNLSIPYDCSGGTSLFGGLICRAGHTFFGATTSLKLTLFVERD
jgi:hypothetical protein